MITRVTIRNLKRFTEQAFSDLGQLHLLVGQNNSGKSTLLHALAIWTYCIEEFRASDRTGSKAIELTLNNFTPLPLSDFRLLWRDKVERTYPLTDVLDQKTGKKKRRQEFISIEIEVEWQRLGEEARAFTVSLRWHNRNTVYASPKGGWDGFRELDGVGKPENSLFPRVVYVPPSANIAAQETRLDEANLRALVGEGRPGSVVRNMILRTYRAQTGSSAGRYKTPFDLLQHHIEEWFGVMVNAPEYTEGRSRYVLSTYTTGQKIELDWVNAGSGLLQSLILLSFLYGFQPDVLLLDEPDAHLHVNLQRTMLDFLSRQTQTQMLIATHAEEFIGRVRPEQISFLTPEGVRRVPDTEQARLALSEVSNVDILNLLARKLIVYVEGETDEECLRGWAAADAAQDQKGGALDGVAFVPLHGGSAEDMLGNADQHFKGCLFLSPGAQHLLVLDRNDGKWQNRIGRDPNLMVWSKRHVESYLLLPAAWERAVAAAAEKQYPLAATLAHQVVCDFFREQSGGVDVDWLDPKLEAFRNVDAKRMLFDARKARGDAYDALAARLFDAGVKVTRGDVATAMLETEIHPEVKAVLERIRAAIPKVPGVSA